MKTDQNVGSENEDMYKKSKDTQVKRFLYDANKAMKMTTVEEHIYSSTVSLSK